MTATPTNQSKWSGNMFLKTELAFLALCGLIFVANLLLEMRGDQTVVWNDFLLGGTACVGLIIIGAYYRKAIKGFEWVGRSAVVIGLGSLFGLHIGIFFHLHMPRPEPVLTEALLRMDQWFGYDWPAATAWVAEVPMLGFALRVVYLSSFPQIAVLMILLAKMHRNRDLDVMMYCNSLSLLVVWAAWQAFPNLSQSTYFPTPPEIEAATHLVTHTAYGAKLLEMATVGLPFVDVESIIGAVAFPSYHMVMAVLTVWFAQRTALFTPILILNIVMIPAILIHGAHHIADVIGGVIVFAVALVLSRWIVDRLRETAEPIEQPALS